MGVPPNHPKLDQFFRDPPFLENRTYGHSNSLHSAAKCSMIFSKCLFELHLRETLS